MSTFDHLLLLGRPAAGKSEFIDFMKKTSDVERGQLYHMGAVEEIDDFFWLWEKFMEDDLWEEAGYDRIYSNKLEDGNYHVKHDMAKLYDFLFSKFNYEIEKKYLNRSSFYGENTLIVEFARGGEEGYHNALSRLSADVLSRAAILYVEVTFDESWRRNVARYQEKLKHSSLAHMAPYETMERYYKIDDWRHVTGPENSGYITYNDVKIPYVTMNNEPELKEYDALAKRYKPMLDALYELHVKK